MKYAILRFLASHQYPRYPTPVLSKAKTAPPLGKGWGWGKTPVE